MAQIYDPNTGEMVEDPNYQSYSFQDPNLIPSGGDIQSALDPNADPWADYRTQNGWTNPLEGIDQSGLPTYPNPYDTGYQEAVQTYDPGFYQTPHPAQTAPQQPTAQTGFNAGSYNSWQDLTNGWFGQYNPTAQSLAQLYDTLKAAGYNVSRPTRAGGAFSDDKLIIDGQMYDFIRDVGGPGAAWQFSQVDEGGGEAGGAGGFDLSSILALLGQKSGSAAMQPLGPTSGQSPMTGNSQLLETLWGLINSGGRPNTDALKLRLEGARETMDRARGSQQDAILARLGDQGMIGDGEVGSSLGRLEEALAGQYGQDLNSIYADEYGRADDRMMAALSLITGMDQASLDRAIRQYEAETGRMTGLGGLRNQERSIENDLTLGLGNLALGNERLGLDYTLGLGNLQLGQDDLTAKILQLLYGQGPQVNEGYQGN